MGRPRDAHFPAGFNTSYISIGEDGKTHLSIALGVKAVENGFSVAFFRLEDLLHAMRRDVDVPPQRLRGKKYLKATLLIVDEIGFQTLTRQEASLFFRLVSYRYQRGSMILTANKCEPSAEFGQIGGRFN